MISFKKRGSLFSLLILLKSKSLNSILEFRFKSFFKIQNFLVFFLYLSSASEKPLLSIDVPPIDIFIALQKFLNSRGSSDE